jgi:hypothetical protein
MKPSILSLVLLLGAVSTTTTPQSVDLTAGLSDTEAAQLLRFYPWTREAQACALGEYTVTPSFIFKKGMESPFSSSTVIHLVCQVWQEKDGSWCIFLRIARYRLRTTVRA